VHHRFAVADGTSVLVARGLDAKKSPPNKLASRLREFSSTCALLEICQTNSPSLCTHPPNDFLGHSLLSSVSWGGPCQKTNEHLRLHDVVTQADRTRSGDQEALKKDAVNRGVLLSQPKLSPNPPYPDLKQDPPLF